jgi:hypothetical protein
MPAPNFLILGHSIKIFTLATGIENFAVAHIYLNMLDV